MSTEKMKPGVKAIQLEEGGAVSVRRAKVGRVRSLNRVMTEIREDRESFPDPNDANFEAGAVAARWGVVAAHGVVDEDGGEIAFERGLDDRYPELGYIASVEIVEAMTIADVVKISQYVFGENIVDESTAGK